MQNWIRLGACGFVCLHLATAETRWTRIESPNFEMYTTSGERSAKSTISYFEQVRSFFAQTMPQLAEERIRVRIVAFNSMKEYEPYRFNEFATAYYRSTADHDYIVMSQTGADSSPTAIHEYVHLVVRHARMNFPPWLNEGIAELYSTLKPMGDKILVGSLIPGRHRALLQEKWIPLATILGADQNSAYYNEKDKAGSLYNEGWALTHMLVLSPDYRPKFSQVLQAISDGAPSAGVLEQTYGKTLHSIEGDLLGYLRGGRFQGMLIPAKLEKMGDDVEAKPADEFDVKLLLAELGDLPSKEEATRKALEELVAANPNRAEAYIALAYLDWRQKRSTEAHESFAKAYELGSRSPRMLWDYGRIVESTDAAKSMELFRELMTQEPGRLDVRLELASVQLRSHAAKEALQTLLPVKKVTPEYAPRLLTLLAYANLEAGDRGMALNAAEQLKKVSTKTEDRNRADQLLQFIEASRPGAAKPALAAEKNDVTRHLDARTETVQPAVRLPSSTGTFLELQCGQPAKVVMATAEGKKLFLIEDPTKLLVNGKSGETMDLSCGPQKPAQIRIEYDSPGSNRPGIDGLVRVIHFDD